MTFEVIILLTVVGSVLFVVVVRLYLSVWRNAIEARAKYRAAFYEHAHRALNHRDLPDEEVELLKTASEVIGNPWTVMSLMRSLRDRMAERRAGLIHHKQHPGAGAAYEDDLGRATISFLFAITYTRPVVGMLARRQLKAFLAGQDGTAAHKVALATFSDSHA